MKKVLALVLFLLLCSFWIVFSNIGVIRAESNSLITVKDEHFIIREVLGMFNNFFVGSFNGSSGYWIELDLSCQSTDNGPFIVYLDILSATHGSIFSAKGTEFSQTVYLDYEDVYNITIAKSPFYSSVRINGIIDVFHQEPVEQQSENWVEVQRIIGAGGIGFTPSFNVDYVDWRIVLEINPSNNSEISSFTVNVFHDSELLSEKISRLTTHETTGILNIYNYSGSFYLDILTANVDSFTMLIEQNTESIPEFLSGSILVAGLSIVLVLSIIFRQKIRKGGKREQN